MILDLYSRNMVGWAIGERLNRKLTLQTLTMALETRSPQPQLLHHSDRGVNTPAVTIGGNWKIERFSAA